MHKQNYKAWNVDKSTFTENGSDLDKLLFFCRYAILAPSGHNSQPWLIHKEENEILLSVNKEHYISGKKSGLLPVEPYVSLGTFIQTLVLAGEGFGYKVSVEFCDFTKYVAKLSIKGRVKAHPEYLDGIVSRVSNRNKFSTRVLDDVEVKKITTNSSFKNIEKTLITDRKTIEYLGDKTELGIKRMMKNKKYRKELGEWVRSNITKKKDGMPGFTHGVPTIPSLVAKYGIIYASSLGPPPSHSKDLMYNSSFLMMIGYSNDNLESHVKVGCLYADLTIRASMLGISSSALGASVIDNITREEVIKEMKLDYRPVVILRFGRTLLQGKHSPRWPIEDVISN